MAQPASRPLLRPPLRLIAVGLLAAMLVACERRSTTSNASPTLPPASVAQATPTPAPAAHATTAIPVPSSRIAGQPGIVAVVFINSSHGWLARGANGQGELFVTDDGGTSWTEEYRGETAPQVIEFVDARNGWMAGCVLPAGLSGDCQTQLRWTQDGGNTWTPETSLPIPQGKAIAIGFVNRQDGWVLTEQCLPMCGDQAPAQLLRTHDGGTTWEPLPLLDGATAPVSLRRLDEHTGWVLTKSIVFATRDGGVTWATAENPCNAVQPGGGMFLTGAMSFTDEHVGWIGCYRPIGGGVAAGALYRSGDGGATWHVVGLTPEGGEALPAGVGRLPEAVIDLDFLNEQDGWFACACPRSGVWRTHNGGHDWDLVDVGHSAISHLLFVDDAHGWAWGSGVLMSTIDGGCSLANGGDAAMKQPNRSIIAGLGCSAHEPALLREGAAQRQRGG